MTKEELLKLLADAPDLKWTGIDTSKLDRNARELLFLFSPQDFLNRSDEPISDSEMLKGRVDHLARRLTIVLLKQGVEPARLEGRSFSRRIKLARQLTSPPIGSEVIELLSKINGLYVMSHDPTLVSFTQDEWRAQIERDFRPWPPPDGPQFSQPLRLRVLFAMYSCAVALDQLGANTSIPQD
jgi:hypothetical protein